ncbi:MAG: fructose-1,6-bisphosphatase [Alphaproteobacteria bacterium]|nr:fructose-1,6-bisphosphatase [Alphaproteobacteria bacterium]
MSNRPETRPTLNDWLAGQGATPALAATLGEIVSACIGICALVQAAPFAAKTGAGGATNIQGEIQQPLDVLAHDLMELRLGACPHVAALVSEEVADLMVTHAPGANLAVCFDPLDGSSNIDTNGVIGTIFSILDLSFNRHEPDSETVLAASGRQIGAGYVMYGPVLMLVLSVGRDVARFAYDSVGGRFELVDPKLTIEPEAAEFLINVAHRRFWDGATTRYIEGCIGGEDGPGEKSFNMRWAGSMVADVHRVLLKGGIFIYPALARPGGENGKLRFLYEVNPLGWLVELAGGLAMCGKKRIGEFRPASLHARVPVAMGSAEEVRKLAGSGR